MRQEGRQREAVTEEETGGNKEMKGKVCPEKERRGKQNDSSSYFFFLDFCRLVYLDFSHSLATLAL